MRLRSVDVPCSLCGAQIGQSCVTTWAKPLGAKCSSHAPRLSLWGQVRNHLDAPAHPASEEAK